MTCSAAMKPRSRAVRAAILSWAASVATSPSPAATAMTLFSATTAP